MWKKKHALATKTFVKNKKWEEDESALSDNKRDEEATIIGLLECWDKTQLRILNMTIKILFYKGWSWGLANQWENIKLGLYHMPKKLFFIKL